MVLRLSSVRLVTPSELEKALFDRYLHDKNPASEHKKESVAQAHEYYMSDLARHRRQLVMRIEFDTATLR